MTLTLNSNGCVPALALRVGANLRRISKNRRFEMGGFGSGRHEGAKKPRVEAHNALKVSDLPRERIPPGAREFTLSYQLGEGAGAKSVMERVKLDRVPTSFGGARTYFRCPGVGCDRRVMALYFASDQFRCRRCHDLAYESQCEDAEQLIRRHAAKARARLGYPAWRPFSLAPIARPKGMRRSKFLRLQYFVDVADEIASAEWVMRTRALADRLDKRISRRGRRLNRNRRMPTRSVGS